MTRPVFWKWIASACLWAISTMAAQAQTAAADRLKALQADPARWQATVASGRNTAAFCANCHGDNGISKIPDVPNLAGQNPAYLLEQIRKFGAGERKDPFMQGLIKAMKDDERLQVAAYFASMGVPAGRADAAAVARGRDLYGKLCARCHGEGAHGNETIPRLAGQQAEYLKKSISRYRDNTGERIYPLMQIATAGLKSDEIAALGAFLSVQP